MFRAAPGWELRGGAPGLDDGVAASTLKFGGLSHDASPPPGLAQRGQQHGEEGKNLPLHLVPHATPEQG